MIKLVNKGPLINEVKTAYKTIHPKCLVEGYFRSNANNKFKETKRVVI